MLQLVLGRAGTGKSTYLKEQLYQAVQAGQQAILLVPEQFSFESERIVYRHLGGAGMRRAEVLSFTRLSNLIFRQYGGLAGRRLDEPTRLVLMSAALDEVADELELYHRSARDSSFLKLMLDITTQLKNANIDPTALEAAAETVEQSGLSYKLREISLIYGTFQALVERSYSDPLDDISRAAVLADEADFFAGYTVFIDEFMSFTAAEHKMLDVILRDSPIVTATFCTDQGLAGEEGGIFYSSSHTALRLKQSARRQGITVKPPRWLETSLRYERPGLAQAEAVLCGAKKSAVSGAGVELVGAQLPYNEVEYAAARICSLLREENLRYRDIVVIARDMERYTTVVETVFPRYGIPFFLDRPVDIETQPAVLALLAALEAVRGDYDTDEILRLAKSPAFGLPMEQVAELENYCYIWGIRGKGWIEPFVNNPRGMETRMGEGEVRELERINRTRLAVMEPLARLREGLRNSTGKQFAYTAYRYLDEIGCAEHIRAFCRSLPAGEEKRELELAQSIWDNLMDLLDMFAAVLGESRCALAKWIDLLRLAVASVDVGQIPRTLDQVTVGAADHIRPNCPKAAFVLGVNEGIFPPVVRENGVFSDRERGELAQVGIELGPLTAARALEERFFLYRSCACPSRYLSVSYASAEVQGRAIVPSLMLEQLLEALPQSRRAVSDLSLTDRVVNLDTAEEELARCYAAADVRGGSLAEFLCREGRGESARRLEHIRGFGAAQDIHEENAQRLFGRDMTLSATRLEEFYRCPFRYYCKYGLGIQPLKKVEFSPLESGTVIHYVLEQMVARHGGAALAHLNELALHQEITALIDEFLTSMVVEQDALPPRTKYLFGRLVSILTRILQRLGAEFAQSLFFPAGMEVKVGVGGEVEPIRVTTPDGVAVTVQGSIDRVDLLRRDDVQYARVVDYKSGSKKFRLSDVYYGLNMQMLVYLFALCEGGQGQYTDSRPAGILYMPAKIETLDTPRRASQTETADKYSATLRMNGLLLADDDVLSAMEAALSGEYIPAKRIGDGYDRYSSLANPRELEQIKRHVKRVIGEMGDLLARGKIAPRPAVMTGHNPCDYCDYTALCHRERLKDAEELKSFSDADFYALLDEEEKRVEQA